MVLVALFAWLYTAVNLKTFPDTTYECDYSPTTVGEQQRRREEVIQRETMHL